MRSWLPDWNAIFMLDLSPLETFVRASAVYLGLIVLFRVVLKRQTGRMGLPDIMLAILASECVSPGLSAEAKSVTSGLVAVATLLFWGYALDRLTTYWPWLARILDPEPVPLVRDGRMLTANMEAEGITHDELAAQLREKGVEDVGRVRSAVLEAGGNVSVVPADEPACIADVIEQYRAASRRLEDVLRRLDKSGPVASPEGATRV